MELVKKIQHFFSYWYLRYLLATELYMVEPWEKVVFHCIMAIFFGLFWWFNYSIVVTSVSQLRASMSYTEKVM